MRLTARFSKPRDAPQPSFAQCGEDAIVDHLLRGMLGVELPRYLDIGAHAPRRLSNTYRFYRRGARGVLVEPDPALAEALARERPGDEVLNVGVTDAGDGPGEAEFFLMRPPTLNTFSREEADHYVASGGGRLVERRSVEVWPMARLTRHVGAAPDFLSVDVEGLDRRVLAAAGLDRWRPKVICVETLRGAHDAGRETKDRELIGLVRRAGYVRYADTYVNTVFVSQEAWRGRRW